MAGKTINAFTSSVDVIITVMESLWKAPPTIYIKENSTQVHPVNISKVGSLTTLPELLLVLHNFFLTTDCEGVPTASNTGFFRRTLSPSSYFLNMASFGNDSKWRSHWLFVNMKVNSLEVTEIQSIQTLDLLDFAFQFGSKIWSWVLHAVSKPKVFWSLFWG